MAEILSYNHYRDMHNDVQFSAMFFGKNFQNIPFFSSTQTAVKEFDSYGLKVFTFTGKERDSETGFSYFGARYYDSDLMTGWLSVDPLADKYPGLSPYAYCANNPVKLVDPDGEEIIAALVGAAINASIEIVSQTISKGFDNLDNGKGFFEDWDDNIDWADVGISAVEGFANGLIPGSGKAAKLAVEGGAMALRSTIDYSVNEKSNGEKVFSFIFGKDEHEKGFGEIGIDMCGELTSFALGKFTQIDNIPFKRQSFAECAFETGFRGSLSGVVNSPFEYWRTDYNKRNPYVKTPKITIEPLERVGIVPEYYMYKYLPCNNYFTPFMNYSMNI